MFSITHAKAFPPFPLLHTCISPAVTWAAFKCSKMLIQIKTAVIFVVWNDWVTRSSRLHPVSRKHRPTAHTVFRLNVLLVSSTSSSPVNNSIITIFTGLLPSFAVCKIISWVTACFSCSLFSGISHSVADRLIPGCQLSIDIQQLLYIAGLFLLYLLT